MLKSESLDVEEPLRLTNDLRKPRIFRRSVTVPQDILGASSDDYKIGLVCFVFFCL